MELRPSTLAWATLATSVAAYDVLCPKGETLSEGVDRALEHPLGRILAVGAIALTASHLMNLLPTQVDPFTRALSFKEVPR
jgi:hypothetical protein